MKALARTAFGAAVLILAELAPRPVSADSTRPLSADSAARVASRLPAAADPREWHAVGAGLDIAMRPLADAVVVLVRVDPDRAELRVVRAPDGRFTARAAAEAAGGLAAINGGFFDHDGRPIGWLVSRGKQISPPSRGWGAFVVRGGRYAVVPMTASRRGVAEAIQAGPRLVISGRPNPGLREQSARRSFVGLDAAGRPVIGSTGPSAVDARELAAFLARAEDEGGAGLVDALNLDGGSSAQLYVRDAHVDLPGVDVPDAIVVVPVG